MPGFWRRRSSHPPGQDPFFRRGGMLRIDPASESREAGMFEISQFAKTLACTATVALCMVPGIAAAARITTFDAPGAAEGTYAIAVSKAGIAGYYFDSSGTPHSFVRASDGTITSFDPTGAESSSASGINAHGTITGGYEDGSGGHGYVRASDGTFTSFDVSGSPATSGVAISARGAIAGAYDDSNFEPHGFVRAPNGTITTFDPAG